MRQTLDELERSLETDPLAARLRGVPVRPLDRRTREAIAEAAARRSPRRTRQRRTLDRLAGPALLAVVGGAAGALLLSGHPGGTAAFWPSAPTVTSTWADPAALPVPAPAQRPAALDAITKLERTWPEG
jgi:hypothetical protein